MPLKATPLKSEAVKPETVKVETVKAETKEGQGYKDKEDEKLSMKHGKIASKDIKTTKGRRDDAGFEKTETPSAPPA